MGLRGQDARRWIDAGDSMEISSDDGYTNWVLRLMRICRAQNDRVAILQPTLHPSMFSSLDGRDKVWRF